MRLLLFSILCLLSISLTQCLDENCVEQPTDSCSKESEYNAYITCIAQSRRSKRSAGCTQQQESCEYTDCEKCQEHCEPSCEDCECPNQCRNCCSQTCSTNLCCHKTCHNQCKTNYCRSECKRECKQRIYESDGSYSGSNKQDIQIIEKNTDTKQTKHNITTIINLHNIINNTNLIDIPIKINNTNYNNITLRRTDSNEFTSSMDFDSQVTGGGQQEENNGEKCCYVVGPRQCVKIDVYPFMKCFHYRHRRCAPYCISTIVHAQPQNFCDDQGCRNKMFYVPQIQPRCSYQPSWPFVSCGQQTFHNCHGCYDHQVNSHHHLRCSRCHDNGFGNGPLYRQGPYYQPPSFYGAASMYGGAPGYFQGFPGGGMPSVYPQAYPPMMPAYQPMMPAYPSYQPYPPISYPNVGNQGMPNFIGAGEEIIDENQNQDFEASGISAKSGDSGNEVNPMLEYPAANYVHETIVTPDQFNPNISLMNDQSKQTKVYNATTGKAQSSRYALISISPENAKTHHEKKDKRFKRKKDKPEYTVKHEDTIGLMLKDQESSTENYIANSTASAP